MLTGTKNDLTVFADGRGIPDDTLDFMIVSVEFVYDELLVLEVVLQINWAQEEAIRFVNNFLFLARSISEYHEVSAKCMDSS